MEYIAYGENGYKIDARLLINEKGAENVLYSISSSTIGDVIYIVYNYEKYTIPGAESYVSLYELIKSLNISPSEKETIMVLLIKVIYLSNNVETYLRNNENYLLDMITEDKSIKSDRIQHLRKVSREKSFNRRGRGIIDGKSLERQSLKAREKSFKKLLKKKSRDQEAERIQREEEQREAERREIATRAAEIREASRKEAFRRQQQQEDFRRQQREQQRAQQQREQQRAQQQREQQGAQPNVSDHDYHSKLLASYEHNFDPKKGSYDRSNLEGALYVLGLTNKSTLTKENLLNTSKKRRIKFHPDRCNRKKISPSEMKACADLFLIHDHAVKYIQKFKGMRHSRFGSIKIKSNKRSKKPNKRSKKSNKRSFWW